MNFEEFKARYERVPVQEYPNEVSENPMVSVCVQTYQHAPYIRECLDGILMQQTDFPFEVVLGEDASTDGTREICIEYAEKYPDKIRLFLHHRDNNIKILGQPSGRFNFLNNLFSSKAKYIAICDGDDYWTNPYKLQKQYDILSNTPSVNLCFHPSTKLKDGKSLGLAGYYGTINKVISPLEILSNPSSICPMQTILFRNVHLELMVDSITKSVGGHWNLQAYYSIPNGVLYIPDTMAVYRVDSTTSIINTVVLTKENFLRHMKVKIEETEDLILSLGSEYGSILNVRKQVLINNVLKSRLVTLKEKVILLKGKHVNVDSIAKIGYIISGEARKLKHFVEGILWKKK